MANRGKERRVIRHHVADHPDWQATQVGRSVVVTDRRTGRQQVIRPPKAWGEAWGWNFFEGGIVLERTDR
jgi:hypothetical protein